MLILFLTSLIRNLLVRAVFASYYFKLSLLVFFECFLVAAQLQPHVETRAFLIELQCSYIFGFEP